MSAETDIPDVAEIMLAELAGLDLTLARHVHACAMSTEDPREVSELSRAYQRIARSARQSLALHARLKRERIRERERVLRENPPPPPPRDEARILQRSEEVRAAIHRVIWTEYERAEDEDLAPYFFDLLEERLQRHMRRDDFGLEPLDDHVVAMCRTLALDEDLGREWRDLADPPEDWPPGLGDEDLEDDAADDGPPPQSSA